MSGLIVVLIVAAVVLLLAAWAVLLYNRLVRARLRVDEAWAQIAVQLRRRHDLIPNLVNAVRGYMEFEEETLTRVIEARAGAVGAAEAGPAQQARAENQLTGALRQLFAVAEAYPALRASENVAQLQEELTTTENQIAFSRQHYNASVRDYHTQIHTLPAALVAGALGFRERDFFEAEPETHEPPEVRLR